MSENLWDDEVDLLVLGTGAGGLAAAVTGADAGLATLVLEKTEFLGGTTAYSAGTCWIPGNRFLHDDGDVEEASRYLDAPPVPAVRGGTPLPRCRTPSGASHSVPGRRRAGGSARMLGGV